MDSLLFKKLNFFNLSLSEIKQSHRFVCYVVNALLKGKRLRIKVLDSALKNTFSTYVEKLRFLVNGTSNLKELCRFWKVKRVQVAKVLIDVLDGKIKEKDTIEKIQNVIENAFIYTTKNSYSEFYYFMLMIKVLYSLSFTLNEKVFSC